MSLRTLAPCVLVALVAAFSTDLSAQETRRYINPQSPGTSGGPFSAAVLVNRLRQQAPTTLGQPSK